MSAEAERWREVAYGARVPADQDTVRRVLKAGDALVAALEAREERIAELEARCEKAERYLTIAWNYMSHHWLTSEESADYFEAVGDFMEELSRRDLPAGRAAGES